MVQEASQYREVRTRTKLIAGGVVGVLAGISGYVAIDHFGPQLNLGMQEAWVKVVEGAGVGLWAGVSTVAILAEVPVPIRQNSQLRRTSPLHKKTS